jgi:hypothetical protein
MQGEDRWDSDSTTPWKRGRCIWRHPRHGNVHKDTGLNNIHSALQLTKTVSLKQALVFFWVTDVFEQIVCVLPFWSASNSIVMLRGNAGLILVMSFLQPGLIVISDMILWESAYIWHYRHFDQIAWWPLGRDLDSRLRYFFPTSCRLHLLERRKSARIAQLTFLLLFISLSLSL